MPQEPTPERSAAAPHIYPLDAFYAEAGRPLPPSDRVQPDEIPEPYRGLLVHNSDMTSTLERFHGRKIHLDVLRRDTRDESYYREVVLMLDQIERPVEFGAIRIHLNLFPPLARRQILDERLPLGYILHQNTLDHSSRPKAFVRIECDSYIGQALKADAGSILYGRRNSLLDGQGRSLAEIVEILPPEHPHETDPAL